MIKKHMYIAYIGKKDIEILPDERVNTATLSYYEDKAVIYFETSHEELVPDDFTKGSIRKMPDGRNWVELTEIFHYFEPKDDSQWQRKKKNKKGHLLVNRLERDMISSYIYYHVEHQRDNQVGVDKFFSIYIYEDIILMYRETPVEKITWDDIKGKNHHGERYPWTKLMNKHFKAWPDGTKRWIEL